MKNILLLVLLSMFGFANENKHTMYTCDFTTYATVQGNFKDDVLKFKIVTNDNDGTFSRKESNSVSQGKIIQGDKGLSFIELTKLGNIITTTMALVPPVRNKQKAVHSKNILIDGKLEASQYYGTCQLVDASQTNKLQFNISKERQQQIYKKFDIENKLKTLSKKDAKYVLDALKGLFPSRIEMEDDMSLEGMILVSRIMEDMMAIP